MSVIEQIPTVSYKGNGTQTQFEFPFPILAEENLSVSIFDTANKTTTYLELGTDYDVVVPDNSYPAENGYIIYVYKPTGEGLPAGYTLTIDRAVPYEQPSVYPKNTLLNPEQIESDLDNLEIQIQQLKVDNNRTLTIPPGYDGSTEDYLEEFWEAVTEGSQTTQDWAQKAEQEADRAETEADKAVDAADRAEAWAREEGLWELDDDNNLTPILSTPVMEDDDWAIDEEGNLTPRDSSINTYGGYPTHVRVVDVFSRLKGLNLKSGQLVMTQGFYEPADGGGTTYVCVDELAESETADGYGIIALNNSKYLKLRIKDYINVKWFGAKGDGVTDDTEAIQNAINYAEKNKKVLMLPCGIYASTNLFIKDDICIKGEIETAFGSYANREHAGVMLLDISDINSDSPFICVENADRIYGFSLLNIRIQGNYHNHVALKLVRTGWSSVITNVTISTFRNSAIYAIDAYDTFINNLTIYESGSMGLIDSNPLYAIVLDGDTDVTNAWHFTNIHIEGCRYMIDFKKSRHIEIVNMKCEMARGTINDDSTNPLILKENGSYEISISSSFFIGSDIDTWRENNQSDFRPPFYIVNNDTEINLHSLIISNCTFTCLRYGMLAIKSNNNTLIENCVFELLNGEFYAIDLNGQHDKLDNCKITAVSDKNATNYPIHINNATCSNNSIILIARTTLNPGVNIAYGHAISYEGYCTITDNTITNNMREFWYFKRVSNTGKPYVKRKGLLILTDDTLKESMDIDVSSLSDNATISLNLDNIADIKAIGLQLSKTLKIDSISNGSVGEEITLFNNTVSANIITGQGLSNDRLWNNNSDVVTLGGNDLISYIYFGWQWREIGRCLQ